MTAFEVNHITPGSEGTRFICAYICSSYLKICNIFYSLCRFGLDHRPSVGVWFRKVVWFSLSCRNVAYEFVIQLRDHLGFEYFVLVAE